MNYRKIVENLVGRRLKRKEVVHHKDEDRNNNDLDNLEIMSLSEHSSLHMTGRTLPEPTKDKLRLKSQSARPKAKLELEDIPVIRNMIQDGVRQWLIAWIYQIDRKSISRIKTKECWGWV